MLKHGRQHMKQSIEGGVAAFLAKNPASEASALVGALMGFSRDEGQVSTIMNQMRQSFSPSAMDQFSKLLFNLGMSRQFLEIHGLSVPTPEDQEQLKPYDIDGSTSTDESDEEELRIVGKKAPNYKRPSRTQLDGKTRDGNERKRRKANPWTYAEKQFLKRLVELERPRALGGNIPWSSIAKRINLKYNGGKSGASASQHYNRVINAADAEFTAEEEKVLLRRLYHHGVKSWARVAENMLHRTDVQCRYRVTKYFSSIPKFAHRQVKLLLQLPADAVLDLSYVAERMQTMGDKHSPLQILWKFREVHGLPQSKLYRIYHKEILPTTKDL